VLGDSLRPAFDKVDICRLSILGLSLVLRYQTRYGAMNDNTIYDISSWMVPSSERTEFTICYLDLPRHGVAKRLDSGYPTCQSSFQGSSTSSAHCVSDWIASAFMRRRWSRVFGGKFFQLPPMLLSRWNLPPEHPWQTLIAFISIFPPHTNRSEVSVPCCKHGWCCYCHCCHSCFYCRTHLARYADPCIQQKIMS
jgi:hypothetical protein